MIFDPNDPRLTAFVLGELDADEHAAIERLVNESSECRQALDEIRATVHWLTKQLHEEQAAHIAPTTVNHQVIEATLNQPVVPRSPWWRKRSYQLAGLAALLLVGVTLSLVSVIPTARIRPDESKTIVLQDKLSSSPRAVGAAPVREYTSYEPRANAANAPSPAVGMPAPADSRQEQVVGLGLSQSDLASLADSKAPVQLQVAAGQNAGNMAGQRGGPRLAASNNASQNYSFLTDQKKPRDWPSAQERLSSSLAN